MTSVHWIIRFGNNARVFSPVATEAKPVPEFKTALQLIWSVLPEKTIDNYAKDYNNRLRACISASDGHFEHIM